MRLRICVLGILFVAGVRTTPALGQINVWERLGPYGGSVSALAADPAGNLFAAGHVKLYRSLQADPQWSELPHFGLIHCIATLPNHDLYVGSVYGLTRSTNNGASFELASYAGDVRTFVSTGANLFLGNANGVYRSPPPGGSWTIVNTGLANTNVHALIADGGLLYAGTDDGVYRSTDQGVSWSPRGMTGRVVTALCLHPTGALFAGTSADGIFSSSNDGVNWYAYGLSEAFTRTTTIVAHPNGTLYTGVSGGTSVGGYRSTNLGVTWDKLPFTTAAQSFLAAPDGSVLAGTAAEGVWRSADGITWAPANSGLDAIFSQALTAAPNGHVFVASAEGIFRSTDDGSSWNNVRPSVGGFPTASILRANAQGLLYWVTSGGSFFRSTNDGIDWNLAHSFGAPLLVRGMERDDVGNQYLLSDGGLQRSTDDGTTWGDVPTGMVDPQFRSMAILIDGDESSLFLGTRYRGVHLSTDDGVTWTPASNGIPDSTEIHALFATVGAVYAGTARGLYFSSNMGGLWRRILGDGTRAVTALTPNSRGDLYAAMNGVHQSMDDGSSWALLPGGPDIASHLVVNAAGFVFALRSQSQLMRTDRSTTNLRVPALSVALHQNSELTAYGLFYGLSDVPLVGPPTLQITFEGDDSRDILMTPVAPETYRGSFNLYRAGTASLTLTGSSWIGWESEIDRALTVDLVRPGVGGALLSADGRTSLIVPGAAVQRETYFTLLETGEPVTGPLLRSPVDVGPGTQLAAPATIEFGYQENELAGRSPAALAVLRWSGTSWTPVESVHDPISRRVSAQVSTLGRFALGFEDRTSIVDAARAFALEQSMPNPARLATLIGFSLPVSAEVTLDVFSVDGRRVRHFPRRPIGPGRHEIFWDVLDETGRRVADGVYVYRLRAANGRTLLWEDAKKCLVHR